MSWVTRPDHCVGNDHDLNNFAVVICNKLWVNGDNMAKLSSLEGSNMRLRTVLATLAIAGLGAAPLAHAQSSSTEGGAPLSSASLGSIGQETGNGPNLGTVSGDRSVGCNVTWVSEVISSRTILDNDYFKDLDGEPSAAPSNAGYMSEVGANENAPGDLLLHHWINGTNSNWRTPVATTVAIDDTVLTLQFEGNTYAEAPTGGDANSFFAPREEAFDMPDYDWDVALPAPTVSGNAADGFTLTYELGDMEAGTATSVQLVGAIADEITSQKATATLTGKYQTGSESCTALQGSIEGTPLGSLAGPLGFLGS